MTVGLLPAIHSLIANERGFKLGTLASDWDGSTVGSLSGDIAGIADGKTGTVNLWLKSDGINAGARVLNIEPDIGSPRLELVISDGLDVMTITGRNAAGTTVLSMLSNITDAGSGFINIMASWNLATPGSGKIYVQNVTASTTPTYVDSPIDYANAGSSQIGSGYAGCLSEFFFHTAYLDLTVAANRAKFGVSRGGVLKPVNLGPNGRNVFGVTPLIYCPTGDPSNNKGSGGNFTITSGAITPCATAP